MASASVVQALCYIVDYNVVHSHPGGHDRGDKELCQCEDTSIFPQLSVPKKFANGVIEDSSF